MNQMEEAVKERFGKIAAVNLNALKEAFDTVTISEGVKHA
jgi:Pyruvate/2-oxoacid:ferredoxin oxidoreductase gamma subunit